MFDIISHDEFYSKKGHSNKPYSIRSSNLTEVMKKNTCVCLTVLDQEKVKDDDHFQEWVKKSSKLKWEGLMLRADSPYKGKRSKDLLKVKKFFDDEYTVIDVKTGPFRYVKNSKEAEEIMLSAVVIQHKGYTVDVGSGFSIEQRKEFYADPSKILGKIVTVQYFEQTKNQDGGISLRFPTLKYIHGDSRDT
jgi:DNA ligase-1